MIENGAGPQIPITKNIANSNQIENSKRKSQDSKDKIQINDTVITILRNSFQADFLKRVEGDEHSPLLGKDIDGEEGLFRRWVKTFKKKDTKT